MLDLSEDGLDDLLSEAVAAGPAGTSELGCHGRDARPRAPSPATPSVALAVTGAARGNESVDAAAGELSEIGLITKAGVGGDLARICAQDAARRGEQWPKCAAVSRTGLQALSDNDLIGAVDRDNGIVTLDDAAATRRLDAAVGIGEVALGAIRRGALRPAFPLPAPHHAGGWPRLVIILRRRLLGFGLQRRLGSADAREPCCLVGDPIRHLVAALVDATLTIFRRTGGLSTGEPIRDFGGELLPGLPHEPLGHRL